MFESAATAELTLTTRIPYSSETAPGVVKLKDGMGYCVGFELEGVDFETCGTEQADIYNKQVETAIQAVPAGTSIWFHTIRRKEQEDFHPDLNTPFCKAAHGSYFSKLSNAGFFRTRLFVCLVLKPESSRTSDFSALVKQELEALQYIQEAADRFQSALSPAYKPERLTHYNEKGITYSRLLSLLAYLINGHWESIPTNTKRLDTLLSSSRLTFADKSGVIAIDTKDGERLYASAIELREYPEAVSADQLDGLLYVDSQFIQTQSFTVMANTDAINKFTRQRTWMTSGGQASTAEINDMEVVIDDLKGSRLVAGEYHFSMTVFADSMDSVRTTRAEITTELEDNGFKAVVQTTVPEASWFFQCPGHLRMRTRVALMTSRNVAALSPLHNFMPGKKQGNPWGTALALFDSPSGQPFYLNFHVSPRGHDSTDKKLPGNTTIFGSTGSGKTTLEMYLINMLDQYDATVVVLDMDRSTEIGVRAMGGTYKAFLRGIPTGINPFQWPDTLKNRAFCKKLVAWLLTGGKSSLSAEEENRVALAVDTVYEVSVHQRRLGIVQQNLPNVGSNSLHERLRKWVGDGDLAWVFDNPLDTLDLNKSKKFGFDYSEFIDDQDVCGPFVLTLLHAIEGLKDGRPIVIFIEEFWKPLQNPAFSEFVRDQLKTIRKENGLVVMTTQQPDDVLEHPLAKTAVQQAVTNIYLPNPKAVWEDYQTFGVTFTEYEIIRSLGQNSRAFLVKQDGKSAVCKFNLNGLDDLIKIFSGTPENSLLLESIRAVRGDDPSSWLPFFLKDAR